MVKILVLLQTRVAFDYEMKIIFQINKRNADDFNESKCANPPYIPVLIVANPDCSKFKGQLQYPLTIEGIEVTVADDSQPNIVLYMTDDGIYISILCTVSFPVILLNGGNIFNKIKNKVVIKTVQPVTI